MPTLVQGVILPTWFQSHLSVAVLGSSESNVGDMSQGVRSQFEELPLANICGNGF